MDFDAKLDLLIDRVGTLAGNFENLVVLLMQRLPPAGAAVSDDIVGEPDMDGFVTTQHLLDLTAKYGAALNAITAKEIALDPAMVDAPLIIPPTKLLLRATLVKFAGKLSPRQTDNINVNCSSAGFNQNRAIVDGVGVKDGRAYFYEELDKCYAELDAEIQRRLRDEPNGMQWTP